MYGHKGVSVAAEFGAESIEGSCFIGAHPDFMESSRDGVDSNTEGGDSPIMDDVLRGDDESDRGARGNDKRIIDGHESKFVGLELVVEFDIGVEVDLSLLLFAVEVLFVIVEVLIVPEPLVAGDFDGELGVGDGGDGSEKGSGLSPDKDEDEGGDDDLNDGDGCIVGCFGGDGVIGGSIFVACEGEQSEYEETDHSDDGHEDDVVEEEHVFGDG